MKKLSAIKLTLMYLNFFIIVPSIIMAVSYMLLRLELSISPIIFIAFAIVPIYVGSSFNNRLDDYAYPISKITKILLFTLIPLLFLTQNNR